MRDVFLVARFELFESLKSTRALVVFILFILGALGMSEGCVRAEKEATEAIAQEYGEEVVDIATAEEARRGILREVIEDDELADTLAAQPIVGIFYVQMALLLLPLLIVILTSDTISRDLANGSVRFSLFRTSRAEWALGKLLGQTVLIETGVLAASVAVLLFTTLRLPGTDVGSFAPWLIYSSLKLTFYAFAYLGIIVGLSQVTRSVNGSRALGLIAIIFLGIVGAVLRARAASGFGADEFALNFLPAGHRDAIWAIDVAQQLTGIAALTAIGLVAFFTLHTVLVWRDA